MDEIGQEVIGDRKKDLIKHGGVQGDGPHRA
jgi:hypothetical protein